MNKRFSTFLATALVASGLSFQASAAVLDLKDGQSVYLKFGSAYLAEGLETQAQATLDENSIADDLKALEKQLWVVTKTEKKVGVLKYNVYTLINKHTSQLFSIKLQSDKKADDSGVAVSSKAATISSDGNVEWIYDESSEGKGLYAISGDSVFSFDSNLKLIAEKYTAGTVLPLPKKAANTPIKVVLPPPTAEIELNAEVFNALLGSGKTLYFNGSKNVSSSEKNVLTSYKWEAVQDNASNIYLKAINQASASNNPKFLVVDTVFYDSEKEHFALNIDTLSSAPKPTAATPETFVVDEKRKATTDASKAVGTTRPAATAQFKIGYYLSNDSIVLKPVSVPKAANVAKTIFYAKGTTTPLDAEATTGQIVLKKLSSATVLTVSKDGTITNYIEPLIQPYESLTLGGTAEIDVTKVYYIKDLRKSLLNYSNEVVKNENEGKYFNESPVAPTVNDYIRYVNYKSQGESFNPYTQYVVKRFEGIDKGAYEIINRGTGETFAKGLTYTIGKDSIFLGSDSLFLVDSKITYAGTDSAKHIGYKAFTDYELINKKIKIYSASSLLNQDLYFHMEEDSTLKLAEGEVLFTLEEADGFKAFGAKVDGVDTLYHQPYYIKNKKGEYLLIKYIPKINDWAPVISKEKDIISTGYVYYNLFFFTTTNKEDTYVINPAYADVINDSYSPYADQIGVDAQTGKLEYVFPFNIVVNDLFYVETEEDPASLFSAPKHIQLNAVNGDLVGIGEDNFGVAARVNDLKSSYEVDDFTFWLDTASYTNRTTGEVLAVPSYYISKGTGTEEEPSTISDKRLYLYASTDSAEVDPDTYKFDTKVRLQFRDAQLDGPDTLKVWNGDKEKRVALAKKDTILTDINDYRFNFFVDEDQEDVYLVRNVGAGEYLQNVNGTLVLGDKENALKVKVNSASAPVGNKDIKPASEFNVVAGYGVITIENAANKTVRVSNILGQTVVSTVLTSNNVTIAAPKGIVVVAVEGEEAVKAIVK